MPSHRAWAWDSNARNANTVPLVPDTEVQMQNFWKPIELLAKIMTNLNNYQALVPTSRNDRSMSARICGFVRMNSSTYLGSHVGKHPEKFIDDSQENILCDVSNL